MDKFQEMRAFVAVVDAGSFVRAAEALAMSKAAVSRYVTELEARLGVRLLQRTTRKLSLTGEGEVFHARCQAAAGRRRRGRGRDHRAQRRGQPGWCKVNVPVTFGILHLAPLWGEFLRAAPEGARST